MEYDDLHKRVLWLFSYDELTGLLSWKNNSQKRFNGREAGYINHHGYRAVGFGKTKLHAHQIIWIMKTGEMATCEIDHINGDRSDNRFCNLRAATQKQNQQNTGVRVDSHLGVKGVRLRPSGRYQARVKLDSGARAVKTFDSIDAAVFWLSMQREESHREFANTPEQIAAEQREKAVQEMVNDCPYPGSATTAIDCLALYKAGYRKFEIVPE